MDDKLRMLCGSPVYVDGIEIKPYTLREIVDIGYNNFMAMVGILCFDVAYFLKELRSHSNYMQLYEKRHELDPLFFYLLLMNDFGDVFLSGLSIALRVKVEDISINYKDIAIEITSDDDVKLIDGKTYNKIIEVLKYQNGMKSFKEEEEDENPADERAKALLEKMKANREKVEKFKSEDDSSSNLDFFDIISSVTVRSNSINKLNVNDLTIFQVYDEFYRLEKIDAYENYLKASMVGAKHEGKAPHWSDKI